MNNSVIVGIASAKNSIVETKLPKVTIYTTNDGSYLLLEREIFAQVLIQSLKNLEREEESVLFVVVEIVPISQRVRRG